MNENLFFSFFLLPRKRINKILFLTSFSFKIHIYIYFSDFIQLFLSFTQYSPCYDYIDAHESPIWQLSIQFHPISQQNLRHSSAHDHWLVISQQINTSLILIYQIYVRFTPYPRTRLKCRRNRFAEMEYLARCSARATLSYESNT